MFSGSEIVEILTQMPATHVVGLPDSTLGLWEAAIRATEGIRLVRVCREGEAWAVAAGLHLAGATPIVLIQCTGLFESGDSLRNAIHDYGLPLFALIGYRNYLNPQGAVMDSACKFTEPIVGAWELDYRVIAAPEQKSQILEHYRRCRAEQRAGCVLIAEGRG